MLALHLRLRLRLCMVVCVRLTGCVCRSGQCGDEEEERGDGGRQQTEASLEQSHVDLVQRTTRQWAWLAAWVTGGPVVSGRGGAVRVAGGGAWGRAVAAAILEEWQWTAWPVNAAAAGQAQAAAMGLVARAMHHVARNGSAVDAEATIIG